jgi:DNA-binding NtrC family response regulator
MISRAALLYDDTLLQPEHLPAELAPVPTRLPSSPASQPTEGPIATLAEVELAHIRRVLALCGGNRTVAAQHLGVTRQTLSRRLEESGPSSA